ncbi:MULTISPECIES: hypothetical protein [Clostridium]|uniref:Uncharacterized protein n=1 Tax=Clostridium carnis TaxID=1530 RepID=A0ABY6SRI0_9CLOT|nr:hypothetical protein [Clostridium carnis]CAI3543045.1 conserved hypothetical protein [Clostridium neonatale]CAI3561595.1 conserved hypothetical protein [Clostridium neonatale]CAI3562862.1 conserved hypothetical protein [Clostridium neonatale]CAI3583835.1 conserved hypothetical protein [Clostridium neonatale]CAI3623565.1 conserved hypothetical protein [Clostridium neonatale]
MEVILKSENKSEVNEMLDFIKSLNSEEQQAFKYLIDGYRFAKALEKRKEVS